MTFEGGMTRRVQDLINAGILEVGDGYRAKNSELGSRGLPFARVANINEGFRFADVDRFPEENLHRVGGKVSRPGDVVFTSKGTVGRVAFVTQQVERFVYSPQLSFWRSLKPEILDPRFLYFWMQGPEFLSQANRLKGQTDMADYVSLGDQRRMTITVPPLRAQLEIGETLWALEDRFSLLREMNFTLQRILQALFKSWFIDFDPVHAKAGGRDPDGMDAATADLFPSEFEESEMGLIPKGWRVMTLGEALEVNPRRDLPKGVEAPYLDMANTPTTGHRPLQITRRAVGSGVKFVYGDILLAKITPSLENGKTAYVDFLQDGEVGWGSTEFIVLRPKPPLPPFFGYLLARYPSFRAFAIQAMSGTSGRQRVELSRLVQYRIVVPDAAVAEAFGRLIEPIRARIAAASEQAQTLAELRDTLLPRLISGKLRIPEAQEAVEEALS